LPLGQSTTYQYDANGNLVQKTTPNATFTYVLDAAGRLTQSQSRNLEGALVRTTSYTWDANNNLIGWTDTDHGRNQTVSAQLTYDAANNKTSETITYPDGETLNYNQTYSLAGRKTKLLNRQLRFDFSRHAPYGPKWQI